MSIPVSNRFKKGRHCYGIKGAEEQREAKIHERRICTTISGSWKTLYGRVRGMGDWSGYVMAFFGTLTDFNNRCYLRMGDRMEGDE